MKILTVEFMTMFLFWSSMFIGFVIGMLLGMEIYKDYFTK